MQSVWSGRHFIFLISSLLPYSEPDQDLSPNNDSPPFDWGEGGAVSGAGGKHKHDKENRDNKHGLTEKLLNDKNNVIGRSCHRVITESSLYRELRWLLAASI